MAAAGKGCCEPVLRPGLGLPGARLIGAEESQEQQAEKEEGNGSSVPIGLKENDACYKAGILGGWVEERPIESWG